MCEPATVGGPSAGCAVSRNTRESELQQAVCPCLNQEMQDCDHVPKTGGGKDA